MELIAGDEEAESDCNERSFWKHDGRLAGLLGFGQGGWLVGAACGGRFAGCF